MSSKSAQFMPISKDPSHMLTALVALAKSAGEDILSIYRGDFTTQLKADQTPLTAADLAAHDRLVSGLSAMATVYPIISEESAETDYALRLQWPTCWLLDPLDGTREFVKRNGEFTVNIALIHQNRPVVGVVHAPALDVTYFAAEACGAFKQQGDQQPKPIHVRSPAADVPVIIGSRSHGSAAMNRLLEKLPPHTLRAMGSSLKFCLVAEGCADFYPRLGPTSEWDTAAAHCVVTEAGGHIVDIQGNPLQYNLRQSLLNPDFLVYGDASQPWLSYVADAK